jgi:hypothetical protein
MPKSKKPRNKVFAMSEDEVLAALTSDPAKVTEVDMPAAPPAPLQAPVPARTQDETIVRRPRAS